MSMTELQAWLDEPEPATFPYDAVVGAYRRVGKHFVADDVLAALAAARETLPDLSGRDAAATLLRRFLQVALDKWDGRYDYPTYTGLCLLPMPSVDDAPQDAATALARRDRLVVHLLADLVAFELATLDGSARELPEMRPDARVVLKRCRHALRVALPALERLGLAEHAAAPEPEAAARGLVAALAEHATPADRRVVQLSMLPVYVSHDEHLFIRVLQLFETTFAMLALQLVEAVHALSGADAGGAAARVEVAESTLRESAPLFSLLGTMRVESFQTFREFTDGASAIQSRNYKIIESLCRRPDPERLNSPAFRSTPEVRQRVLAGHPTLDDVLLSARAAGSLDPERCERLEAAMVAFEATLRRWRQTHYRLAVRMLGECRGTGRTEGPPYLGAVRDIDVFRSVGCSGREVQRDVA